MSQHHICGDKSKKLNILKYRYCYVILNNFIPFICKKNVAKYESEWSTYMTDKIEGHNCK